MAFVLVGKSECSICGQVLSEGQEITSTSHFLEQDHPLGRHSDTPMHRGCFEGWEHRRAFSEAYLERYGHHPLGQRSVVIFDDESCQARLLPLEGSRGSEIVIDEDPTVWVYMKDSMAELLIPASGWREWCSLSEHTSDFAGLAQQRSRSALRARFPNVASLSADIDLAGLAAAARVTAQNMERQALAQQQAREDDLASYNRELDRLARGETPCPHCGAPWSLMRYYDLREKGKKSLFICQACERSSHLSDFGC